MFYLELLTASMLEDLEPIAPVYDNGVRTYLQLPCVFFISLQLQMYLNYAYRSAEDGRIGLLGCPTSDHQYHSLK